MSTARHIFEAVLGIVYIPEVDRPKVMSAIVNVLENERNTVPAPGDSAEAVQNAVSAAVDAPPRPATDAPVLIPAESNTPRGRADIRMGRRRGL